MDPKSIHDNQKSWEIVKPLFSGIIKNSSGVTLLENNDIISNDKSVAEIFNDYFVNITSSLGIEGIEETGKNTVSTQDIDDPVEITISKYSSNSTIKNTKETFHPTQKFEFRPCSAEEVMTRIERLD